MIQRVAVLFAITGAGHGLSIITLKLIANNAPAGQVTSIAETDSLLQLLIGLIGFGMQTDAIRNIALSQNWKQELAHAQQARFTLSLFLTAFVVFVIIKDIYTLFLVAPLLALSNEYALYARGYPVIGASIAFVRIALPLLLTLICVWVYPEYLWLTYLISTVLCYGLTNFYTARYLEVAYFYKPELRSLSLYLKTLPLGVITICLYFFGLGLLLLSQYFFYDSELVVVFLALKFYLIYKGAIRVVQQAFVNQMLNEEVCLKIDRISMLIGLLFLGSVLIFPKSFITLFFSDKFIVHTWFFILLSMAALIFCVFYSAATSSILKNKDIVLMKILLTAVLVSVCYFFVTMQFNHDLNQIATTMLIGELWFCLGLALFFFTKEQIRARIYFLIQSAVGLITPWIFKLIWGDTIFVYMISFTTMGLILFVAFYKKLNVSPTTQHPANYENNNAGF